MAATGAERSPWTGHWGMGDDFWRPWPIHCRTFELSMLPSDMRLKVARVVEVFYTDAFDCYASRISSAATYRDAFNLIVAMARLRCHLARLPPPPPLRLITHVCPWQLASCVLRISLLRRPFLLILLVRAPVGSVVGRPCLSGFADSRHFRIYSQKHFGVHGPRPSQPQLGAQRP